MNDLYIHQLETENKQLREVLKINHQIIDMYVERIDKAIKYIKEHYEYKLKYREFIIDSYKLLKILGDKE